MCTVFFCECDSSTRLRGKNRQQPITKKALGFYSVLVSPDLTLDFPLRFSDLQGFYLVWGVPIYAPFSLPSTLSGVVILLCVWHLCNYRPRE